MPVRDSGYVSAAKPTPPKKTRGGGYRAKIPDEKVREVRKLRDEGHTYKEIAYMTNMKYQWVLNVCVGILRSDVI